MLQGANSSGDAGLGGDRYTQRAGYRQCRMPGNATIPAPCYPAARAEDVEAEIELPFAAPYQAGGILDRRECLPDLWCDVLKVAFGATAGQRQIIFVAWLAVPDLSSEMAADQTPLCASSAYVEITSLRSSLKAD
jgi:hypothetical protein